VAFTNTEDPWIDYLIISRLEGCYATPNIQIFQDGRFKIKIDPQPKLDVAHLFETLARRLALVLHEGEVPRLGRPTKVVGRQPHVVRRRGLLTAEELLAMVEPVQRIVEVIVCRELQLVEARDSLTGTLRLQRRPGGC
jgi:hypothetical protein